MNYCNNKDLRKEIEIYQKKLKKDPDVQMQNNLGIMFLDLTKNIATKPNFRNYNDINDWKGIAIEKCIKAAKKFDLKRKTKTGQLCSAFSYFTQVIFHAYIAEIKKMKKNKEIPIDFLSKVDKFYFLSSEYTIERFMEEEFSF